jgi:hypothetical protein
MIAKPLAAAAGVEAVGKESAPAQPAFRAHIGPICASNRSALIAQGLTGYGGHRRHGAGAGMAG